MKNTIIPNNTGIFNCCLIINATGSSVTHSLVVCVSQHSRHTSRWYLHIFMEFCIWQTCYDVTEVRRSRQQFCWRRVLKLLLWRMLTLRSVHVNWDPHLLISQGHRPDRDNRSQLCRGTNAHIHKYLNPKESELIYQIRHLCPVFYAWLQTAALCLQFVWSAANFLKDYWDSCALSGNFLPGVAGWETGIHPRTGHTLTITHTWEQLGGFSQTNVCVFGLEGNWKTEPNSGTVGENWSLSRFRFPSHVINKQMINDGGETDTLVISIKVPGHSFVQDEIESMQSDYPGHLIHGAKTSWHWSNFLSWAPVAEGWRGPEVESCCTFNWASQRPFMKDEEIMDVPLIIKQVCQQPSLMEVMQRGSGPER